MLAFYRRVRFLGELAPVVVMRDHVEVMAWTDQTTAVDFALQVAQATNDELLHV